MSVADASSAIHGWAHHSDGADWVMTIAAQDLIYVAVAILVALWFRPAALRAGLAAGLGALLALAVGAGLGQLYPEARPFVAEHFVPLFPHDSDASFPSDHLAVLGALTAGAWFGSRRLGMLAVALSAVLAFARVFAGVHYVGDVLVGFLLGAVSGVAVWYALAPTMPLVVRLDGALQARHLRPRAQGPPPHG